MQSRHSEAKCAAVVGFASEMGIITGRAAAFARADSEARNHRDQSDGELSHGGCEAWATRTRQRRHGVLAP